MSDFVWVHSWSIIICALVSPNLWKLALEFAKIINHLILGPRWFWGRHQIIVVVIYRDWGRICQNIVIITHHLSLRGLNNVTNTKPLTNTTHIIILLDQLVVGLSANFLHLLPVRILDIALPVHFLGFCFEVVGTVSLRVCQGTLRPLSRSTWAFLGPFEFELLIRWECRIVIWQNSWFGIIKWWTIIIRQIFLEPLTKSLLAVSTIITLVAAQNRFFLFLVLSLIILFKDVVIHLKLLQVLWSI